MAQDSGGTSLGCVCAQRRDRRWIDNLSPNTNRKITPECAIEEVCFHVQRPAHEEALTVAITFHIPGPLREFTDRQSAVTVEGPAPTLAAALAALWARYPGVRDRIATDQGLVREHINLFVGNDNIRYTGGLATPLPENAEITIVPAISGG